MWIIIAEANTTAQPRVEPEGADPKTKEGGDPSLQNPDSDQKDGLLIVVTVVCSRPDPWLRGTVSFGCFVGYRSFLGSLIVDV